MKFRLVGDQMAFIPTPSDVVESLRDKAAEATTEVLLGVCDALKDLLLAGTLVGTGLFIILKVAGWRDGGRWAGVLIVLNILIKYLFGGF
jgi:hypothetical protein